MTQQHNNLYFLVKYPFKCVCVSLALSHSDDVDEVVLPQRVQDGVDGVFGDGHLQPLHAAADVHHDDDVLGGRGGLDVPAAGERTEGRGTLAR